MTIVTISAQFSPLLLRVQARRLPTLPLLVFQSFLLLFHPFILSSLPPPPSHPFDRRILPQLLPLGIVPSPFPPPRCAVLQAEDQL
uniref:Uncharacterized protein n=1 Tax=Globodera rostochiensis TaxID=31243 RepID=A0A914I906_GLORO